MLEKQQWMIYAQDLYFEWMQVRDEGKDVQEYEEMCQLISKKAQVEPNKALSELALVIKDNMFQAPITKDFPFVEPSDLEGIRKERPQKRHHLTKHETDNISDLTRNKLTGAWIGRISGCLLGKPVECMMKEDIDLILKGTQNYPMNRYILLSELTESVKEQIQYEKRQPWQNCWADTIGGIAPIDDDTNYTVFALKLLKTYGSNFRPNDVLEAWLSWIPMIATCTAERIAYRNAAMGLYAPETATHLNPYREWIGAQIRGDFFGYIHMGDIEKAAEMAWRDASISHVKNGIYGEMFVAAMIAAAGVSDEVMTVIESGLDEIPQYCRLRRDVNKVIEWFQEGLSETETIDQIHKAYDEKTAHGWCHTNPNAMVVVMALLFGQKDFGKSICLAVQAAFDTDCNGATVGSIIGMLVGAQNIPVNWYDCYHQQLATSISGYNQVTVAQLVEETLEVIKNI